MWSARPQSEGSVDSVDWHWPLFCRQMVYLCAVGSPSFDPGDARSEAPTSVVALGRGNEICRCSYFRCHGALHRFPSEAGRPLLSSNVGKSLRLTDSPGASVVPLGPESVVPTLWWQEEHMEVQRNGGFDTTLGWWAFSSYSLDGTLSLDSFSVDEGYAMRYEL